MHEGRMGEGHHMGHGMHVGGLMGKMGGMRMGMMGGPMGMHGMCPMCGRGMRHMGPQGIAMMAKRKLLVEKVEAKLEQKYGEDLDKIADEIIAFVEEYQRAQADYAKKGMQLWQKMSEVFAEETMEAAEGIGEGQEGM